MTNTKNFKKLIAESHKRQFGGEDWQAVAIDIATENAIDFESDAYTELTHGPEPYCDCGFCETAEWED